MKTGHLNSACLDILPFLQAYFSAASNLHSTQVRAFMAACNSMIKKGGEEDIDGMLA